jgi:hypothetical protein
MQPYGDPLAAAEPPGVLLGNALTPLDPPADRPAFFGDALAAPVAGSDPTAATPGLATGTLALPGFDGTGPSSGGTALSDPVLDGMALGGTDLGLGTLPLADLLAGGADRFAGPAEVAVDLAAAAALRERAALEERIAGLAARGQAPPEEGGRYAPRLPGGWSVPAAPVRRSRPAPAPVTQRRRAPRRVGGRPPAPGRAGARPISTTLGRPPWYGEDDWRARRAPGTMTRLLARLVFPAGFLALALVNAAQHNKAGAAFFAIFAVLSLMFAMTSTVASRQRAAQQAHQARGANDPRRT